MVGLPAMSGTSKRAGKASVLSEIQSLPHSYAVSRFLNFIAQYVFSRVGKYTPMIQKRCQLANRLLHSKIFKRNVYANDQRVLWNHYSDVLR